MPNQGENEHHDPNAAQRQNSGGMPANDFFSPMRKIQLLTLQCQIYDLMTCEPHVFEAITTRQREDERMRQGANAGTHPDPELKLFADHAFLARVLKEGLAMIDKEGQAMIDEKELTVIRNDWFILTELRRLVQLDPDLTAHWSDLHEQAMEELWRLEACL